MSSKQRLFDVLHNRGGSTKVYGRDHELGLVQDAFCRVAEDDCNSSEVVLIHGPSGCGKSAIVKAFQQWTKDESGDAVTTFFGSEKYDQLVNNEPFAAIIAASNELCENVLKAGPHIIKRFNDRFKTMVDGDATVLSNAIPALAKLLRKGSSKNQKSDTANQTQGMASAIQTFTRFKQLWRSMLLAIASCTDVVVLFLDDVQWADPNSIDLIHTMTKVTKAHNILFVCAFRDDATVEKAQGERIRWCFSLDDRRSGKIDNGKNIHCRPGKNDSTEIPVPLTDIALDNLNDQATVEFVMGILYGDQQEEDTIRVTELSSVLHEHTDGNAFFILYYLDFLSNVGLLTTTNNGISWEWNLPSIINQSQIPNSIADLLSRVINRLSDDTLQVLTIGAHVGFEFSSRLFQQEILANYITTVGHGNNNTNTPTRPTEATSEPECGDRNHTCIAVLLQAAVQEGLLENNGYGVYSFPHDQIQQALYSRLSKHPQEQQQLHLCIGKAMLQIVEVDQSLPTGLVSDAESTSMSRTSGDTTLFVAVDNVNRGSNLIDNPEERDAVIRLNYNAAHAALGKSAVEGAAQYIRAAVALLPLGCWRTQYELTLDVYSLAARLERNTGNVVRCRTLINEIQTNSKTILDKLPSYFIEIDMLGAECKFHEALALGSTVLKELGENVSAKPGLLALVFELRRATKLLNKTKAAGFDSLSLMTDPKKEAAMSVLSSMLVLSYIVGTSTKNLTAIAILRIVTLSCLHGLSPYSPYGVVCFAYIQATLGDFAQANEIALIGLNLIDRIPGADAFAGRTQLVANGLIFPWVKGNLLPDIHPRYIRSLHAAMAHGDIDQAFFGPVHHLATGAIRGTPIEELHDDYEKYIQAMKEYQVNQVIVFPLAQWQLIRMMTGRGDRTVEGDNLDVTSLYKTTGNTHKGETAFFVGYGFKAAAKIMLGTYGDDLEEDEQGMAFMIKHLDCLGTHVSRILCDVAGTVGCMILHKKTSDRKYYRFQLKIIRKLEKFYKSQAPLATAPYLLVMAETMANRPRRKTWEDIQRAYLEAIEAARENGGFVFVEAYGYEKLAKLAEDRSDGPKALFYLQEALATYTRWGATVKINELTERLAVRR